MQTYARPEAIDAHHADYAAGITAKILDFYEKHLEQEYGMRKLGKTSAPKCILWLPNIKNLLLF